MSSNILFGRHPAVSHFIKCVERLIPINLADRTWDNVGLLLESPMPKISQSGTYRVLLTIDLTESVYREAIDKEISFILAYHPPWFRAEKSLTLDPTRGIMRMVTLCAASGISIYSPHSAIDCMAKGNADWVCDVLSNHQVKNTTPIKVSIEQTDCGFGRLAQLSSPINIRELLSRWASYTGQSNLRIAFPYGKDYTTSINNFAVCVGSGASILLGSGADLYFTGEMSHHDILRATIADQAIVVLTEHTNCERGYLKQALLPNLVKALDSEDSLFKFEIQTSELDRDPIEYYQYQP